MKKRIGILFAIMFVLSTAVYAGSYTITITMKTSTSGTLEFRPLGINVQCLFDSSTPIIKGSSYRGAATRMDTKKDSVTGERRPGIYIPVSGRQIFIHEGTSLSWSDGCIVIPRDKMMQIWKHIVDNGDEDEYVVTINVY
jgi:hypothetical protein